MTPMIDVVFQLLVYFIVTMKPVDIEAHLDVFRPSTSRPPEVVSEPPKMIQIEVLPNGLVINTKPMSIGKMTVVLQKLGAIKATQTVIIKCAADSEHDQLIEVLDSCTKAGLTSLSIVSMD